MLQAWYKRSFRAEQKRRSGDLAEGIGDSERERATAYSEYEVDKRPYTDVVVGTSEANNSGV